MTRDPCPVKAAGKKFVKPALLYFPCIKTHMEVPGSELSSGGPWPPQKPPLKGGLREAVGGRLMLFLHYMKKKESRQSGPTFPGMGRYRRSRGIGCTISQGTHEADCQNALGTNEDIGKQELSLGRAPQRGERAHRFEESIISVCFPLKFPVASSHSSPLSLLRSQLPQGG